MKHFLAITILLYAAGHADAASRNFVAMGTNPELAAQIEEAAETFRRELAIDWLGKELPPWPQRCPISVDLNPTVGAGGGTSFVFDRGQVFGWEMHIQGPGEEIVGSVLRHEVLHTVFATHFLRPLPRWADEGAAATEEQPSERNKQQKMLVAFLKSGRGIAFDKMFAMVEYPRDILPLYAQAHSLATFLLEHDSRPHFVDFVRAGLIAGEWTGPVQNFYAYSSLGALQDAWLQWVRAGSPVAGRTVAAYGGVQPRCRFKWNGRGFIKVCEQPQAPATIAQPQQQPASTQGAGLEPVSPPQAQLQDAFDHATLATKDELAAVVSRVKTLEIGRGELAGKVEESVQAIAQHSDRLGLVEKAKQDVERAIGTLEANHGELAKGLELLSQHHVDLSTKVHGIDGQITDAIEEAGPVLAKSAAKQALTALGEKGLALSAEGGGAASLGAGALGALGGWSALVASGPVGIGLGVAGWLIGRAVRARAKQPVAGGADAAAIAKQLAASFGALGAARPSAAPAPQTQTVLVDRQIPAPPPVFVPTQVNDPAAVALQGALEKVGSLGPQEAALVRKIFSFRDVLMNQAAAS